MIKRVVFSFKKGGIFLQKKGVPTLKGVVLKLSSRFVGIGHLSQVSFTVPPPPKLKIVDRSLEFRVNIVCPKCIDIKNVFNSRI